LPRCSFSTSTAGRCVPGTIKPLLFPCTLPRSLPEGFLMPFLGAHMSIAGGLHKALEIAVDHGCGTVQLFTKTANQWKAKDLTDEDVALFRKTLRRSKLKYPTAHDSYLINLASPDQALYRRSLEAFIEEVQRAERLGLRYLVIHPGSPCGA